MRRLRLPFGSSEPEPRLMAVLDTCVLVGAVRGKHPSSPNRRTVELGTTGVYIAVLSHPIRTETYGVLARPEHGAHSVEEVNLKLHALWSRARWVALADDDEAYRAAARDPADVMLLRTAMGVYLDGRYAREPLYVVTDNLSDLPATFGAIRIVDPKTFLERLEYSGAPLGGR